MGGYQLEAEHKKLIEDLVKEQLPIVQLAIAAGAVDETTTPGLLEMPKPKLDLDLSQIDAHHLDADEIRDKLLAGLEFEVIVPEPAKQIGQAAEADQPEADLDGDAYERFARRLTDPQTSMLAVIIDIPESATKPMVKTLATKNGMMPAAFLDSINDLAYDTIGDALFDSTVYPLRIYEEYADAIANMLELKLKGQPAK